MPPNNYTKNNRLEKLCASESIIQHGIVDYLLTHMLERFI